MIRARSSLVWLYGLFSDKPGNFVKKTIRRYAAELCSGSFMGVPVRRFRRWRGGPRARFLQHAYITSYFMRARGDRRSWCQTIERTSRSSADFAETGEGYGIHHQIFGADRDRAVYTLSAVLIAVPEVFASSFDVRVLLKLALLSQRPEEAPYGSASVR